MRHEILIYWRLISVQIRSQVQYRLSFVFDTLSTGLTAVLAFLSLSFVIQRFGSIAGWSLGEVGFLYGMVEAAFGLMDMIFSGFDPANFGRQVRLGRFDQLLLRPVNLTLQVLGSEFILRRLGRVAQGAAIWILAIQINPIEWSPGKIIYLPVVFASLVCFFGGLFIIGATITFWTVESIEVINIFTSGGTEMISYPMHIYADWMRRFFTYIIPAIFLNYYPSLYFLGKPDPFHLPAFAPFLSPFVGGGMMGVALLFWKFGIRHYQGAGT